MPANPVWCPQSMCPGYSLQSLYCTYDDDRQRTRIIREDNKRICYDRAAATTRYAGPRTRTDLATTGVAAPDIENVAELARRMMEKWHISYAQ